MRRLFGQARERERRDELLSAYLDGELSAGERARLEAQLVADPALQAELDALRQTVALMRALPLVPSPRNFILPQTTPSRPRPAPLARPRRAWAAPLLTAATAVASLLFVAVLSLDLFLPRMAGNLAFAPEPQMAAEAPQETLVVQEIEAAEAVEDVSPPAEEALTEMPPAAPNEAELGAGRAPEEEKAGAPVTDSGGIIATPTPLATTLAAAERSGEGAEHWDSIPEEPAEVAPQPVEEETPEPSESETVGAAQPASQRPLEIVLGLIALTLALATVWAWRVRR